MCLIYRKASRTPYNRTTIRWKVARPGLLAPCQLFAYKADDWNVAQGDDDNPDFGFHVFVSRSDAEHYQFLHFERSVLLKIRVRGFLRSGGNSGWPRGSQCAPKRAHGLPRGETWREFKILEQLP